MENGCLPNQVSQNCIKNTNKEENFIIPSFNLDNLLAYFHLIKADINNLIMMHK